MIEEDELRRMQKSGRLLTIKGMYMRGWTWNKMFQLLGHITYYDPTTHRRKYYWKLADVERAESNLSFYLMEDD